MITEAASEIKKEMDAAFRTPRSLAQFYEELESYRPLSARDLVRDIIERYADMREWDLSNPLPHPGDRVCRAGCYDADTGTVTTYPYSFHGLTMVEVCWDSSPEEKRSVVAEDLEFVEAENG